MHLVGTVIFTKDSSHRFSWKVPKSWSRGRSCSKMEVLCSKLKFLCSKMDFGHADGHVTWSRDI